MTRSEDLQRFYDLIQQLRTAEGGGRHLIDCTKASGWPSHGVYFFFEDGEHREGGEPRVVRVGTHAVSAGSKTTLWNRLSAHRGAVGGSQPGGGNHRGSVFRLHVGNALIARGDFNGSGVTTWGIGGNAAKAVRQTEYRIEQAVSRYIGAMTLLWVAVAGEAGHTSDRKLIEANAIALLTNRRRAPLDPPSIGWLGNESPHPAIRESGLWNVQHVDDRHDPSFLNVLEGYVHASVGKA